MVNACAKRGQWEGMNFTKVEVPNPNTCLKNIVILVQPMEARRA